MIKYIERYPVLSLLLFVIVMLGFTVGSIPVSIMEARNFITAREMITDGNWILTTMNGIARYEKPPLPSWAITVFGLVFGIKSVLALRWPALLCLAGIGITNFLLSKKLDLTKSHSLINGFISITSFYIIGIALEAPSDIFTHTLMLVAVYQLYDILKNEKVSFIRAVLFILFLCASLLSKGPVSLYIVFLPFLIAYGIVYKFKGGVLFFLRLISLTVLGIVIGGSWYLYVYLMDSETLREITTTEANNWVNYDVRPFYYYWSFFTQSGFWTIAALISLIYPYLKTRVSNLKAYQFSFFWTIFGVILLSVIPEKKSRYLMPVLIPLAINIGFYIEYIMREFKNFKTKKETLPVYIQFGILGIIPIALSILSLSIDMEFSKLRMALLIISILITSILIIRELIRKNIKQVFYLSLLFMLCIGLFGIPVMKTPVKDNYKPVSELKHQDLPIYRIDYIAPEVVYNFGEKIICIQSKDGYELPGEQQFLVLEYETDISEVEILNKLYTIEFINTYDLNPSDKSSSQYNERLINRLYKFTLKDIY
ncbi:MAG: glycosyltransferase [Winogradskyella sp.]|uniref:ArnT family glycosyltransferase n=1 Tax=Winogradskyella sp. TaxID=1883156 RepID=UPI000F3FAF31|nr:glycosyltransferase [Winogradskyella sp.]RNC86845.1 MAG: glycosyltransferase [Winogradskyella sp.]